MMKDILYVAQVIFSALIVSLTAYPLKRIKRRYLRLISNLSFIFTEYSLILLVIKLIILIKQQQESGYLIYLLDVGVLFALWALCLHNYFSKKVVIEQTKSFKIEDTSDPPPCNTVSFWVRLMNPFWSAKNIITFPDISYATSVEAEIFGAEADLMKLDVLVHQGYTPKSPVLIYIHSGKWSRGDKKSLPPFLHYMLLKKTIVVSVNHKLSPKNKYPEHLIDIKRCIRFVRENIEMYGGDPASISISGANSGAHLAIMAGLTQNDAFYQPNFTSVDTSIQAVVGISAGLDLTNSKKAFSYKFEEWFTKNVLRNDAGFLNNEEFLTMSSPLMILKLLEASKKREDDETKENSESSFTPGILKNGVLPPLLLIHGTNDVIFPVKAAREFAQLYKKLIPKTVPPNFVYLEFTFANNAFYGATSPRAHYLAYSVDRFLSHIYRSKKDEKK